MTRISSPEDFVQSVDTWIKSGGKFPSFSHHFNLSTLDEAKIVVKALKHGELYWFGKDVLYPNLFDVAACMQSTYSPKLEAFFKKEACPLLYDAICNSMGDDIINNLKTSTEKYRAKKWNEAQVFALKVLAGFGRPEDSSLIIEFAKTEKYADHYVWGTIFDYVARFQPEPAKILDALRAPLPAKFCNIAYLDFANRLAFDNVIENHPFDTDAGIEWLTEYLNFRKHEYSMAASVVKSLPYLSPAKRRKLGLKASWHPGREVRSELRWARYRLGGKWAQRALKRRAKDPRYHSRAVKYCKALGIDWLGNKAVNSSKFKALVKLSDWLSNEQYFFGQAPRTLRPVKQEKIIWPDKDRTTLFWAVKYAGPRQLFQSPESGIALASEVGFERHYDYEDKLVAYTNAVIYDERYKPLVQNWPDADWCRAQLIVLNPGCF